MPKFKKDDIVLTADQRKARVIEVRDDADSGPRYYIAYAEGGGRGWWPEGSLAAPKPEPKAGDIADASKDAPERKTFRG